MDSRCILTLLKQIRIVCLVVIVISFTCCNKNGRSNLGSNELFVNLSDDPNALTPDSIYDSVKYVPLETNDESLIYNIDKVVFFRNCYYVLDSKQASIIVFNEHGKFIIKLSEKGSGPREYLSIEDFTISDDSLVYVLTSSSQKILVYNKDFKYIKTFNTETYCSQIEIFNNSIFLYCNFYSSELKNIYIIDRNSGEIENKFLNFKKKQYGDGYSNRVFARDKGTLYATFPFDFNIYRMKESGYDKYIYIDFNGKQIANLFFDLSAKEREKYVQENYSNFFDVPVTKIKLFSISKHYVFFTFVYKCMNYSYIFNRINRRTFSGFLIATEKYPLADSEIISIENGQIIASTNAEKVLDRYEKNSLKKQKIVIPDRLINGIKNVDNPILSIYTLKNIKK